jgi:hypothetical protein
MYVFPILDFHTNMLFQNDMGELIQDHISVSKQMEKPYL